MSLTLKTTATVPLEDLGTVRFVCRRGAVPCGGVAEFPIARLSNPGVAAPVCPCCNRPFDAPKIGALMNAPPFLALSHAITHLAGQQDFGVEFVVPVPE